MRSDQPHHGAPRIGPGAEPQAPYLLLTLRTTAGRIGTQVITCAGKGSEMSWDRDGDDPTDFATFEYFCVEEVEGPTDVGELDGDTWRALESDSLPLTTVLRWMTHPQFFGSLSGCLTAALHSFDPDGWTDAHERVLELEAALHGLQASLSCSRELAQLMSLVLDRLAGGEAFDTVVEQTSITARVLEALRVEA